MNVSLAAKPAGAATGAATLAGAVSVKKNWETALLVLAFLVLFAMTAALLFLLIPRPAALQTGAYFLLGAAATSALLLVRLVRQEKTLRLGDVRVAKLIEYSPDGILLVEPSTLNIRYANRRAGQILGISPERIQTGKITDAAVDPQPDGVAAAAMAHQMAADTFAHGEASHVWRVRRAGGTQVNLQVRSIVLPGENHVFLVSLVDLSERSALQDAATRAEEQLRLTEARFRHLAQMSSDWYWETAPDGRFSLLEGGAEAEQAGMRQMIGRLPWEIRGFRPIACSWHEVRAHWQARRVYRQILRYQAPGQDASDARVLEVIAEPLPDLGSGHEGYRGVVQDITSRRATESRLAESEERFRKLVELSMDGVVIHEHGRIAYANPGLHAMLKIPEGESLAGGDIYAYFAPDCARAARARENDLREIGDAVPFVERRLRRSDGTWVEVEAAASVIELSGRKMIQGQLRDISARKWTEREILRLNASLEARVEERTAELKTANGELEAFSYTVAHDLRAPLRAIDGYSHMLRFDMGEHLSPEVSRDLSLIGSNARKMGQLIDGLLNFARLGRSGLQPQRVDSAALAAAVAHEAAPDGNVVFEISGLPEVWADAAMLRQVWVNLIGNAVKFSTQTGAPRVQIECQTGDSELCFAVRDNGCGFDPKYAAKLFGVFQRLHSTQEFDGTGVGLAIVRRIVERHGGRVWAEGVPGEGACFYFTLPHAGGAPAAKTAQKPAVNPLSPPDKNHA